MTASADKATALPVKADTGLTPLMRQYSQIKNQNPDTVLLYRMGDFYEMFNDDAKIASKVLGLTLTSRNNGAAEETPLAGFPYHALDRYANKLVRAGHKIAICEQTEDPKLAKGLVKRDIIEVITAGTAVEDSFIEEKSNNFIVGVVFEEKTAGLAVCDLSTGQFSVEEIDVAMLDEELVRIDPSEILATEESAKLLPQSLFGSGRAPVVSRYDGWKFSLDNATLTLQAHFEIASLQALGLEGFGAGIRASGGLLSYLKEQKRSDLRHITSIVPQHLGEFAQLDPSTIRNLELLKPMNADDIGGTLLSVLDRTATAMGGRMLRRWMTHPLKDAIRIGERLDCVEWFTTDVFARRETELFLRGIADIERLIGRITFDRANGRDLVGLKRSLELFPKIAKGLSVSPCTLIRNMIAALGPFDDLVKRIGDTIVEDPPLSIREGGLICKGVSPELDEIVAMATGGKEWIAAQQQVERQRTGISSLKISYNKNFGYYIEISKTNLGSVPDDYIRKQTLVNGERYITPALKEMEGKVLGAEERRAGLEYEIFTALRREVATRCGAIQKAADAIATLDVLISFARNAAEYSYCRPYLNDSTDLFVKEGRHPVVERMNPSEQFIPNDANLSVDDGQILLITGPNMAGKSTYLRQNALIAIMAQIGSFVPAAAATIGIVDKFFTRVGASDRLARGQSTFLVEMIEVANILNNATDRSFVLLDEVGRGTSTFDGISIAWAVAEYLHETEGRRPRTFFATHYHELTELALLFPRIKNLHIKVKEWNEKIIFLRKIAEGGCDHSYGIQVARLAGVPKPVILRAKEILSNLETMELTPDQKPALARHSGRRAKQGPDMQVSLFAELQALEQPDPVMESIKKKLSEIDVNAMTPMEALKFLADLKGSIP
jgi:DNA mismatch repair protein MutS